VSFDVEATAQLPITYLQGFASLERSTSVPRWRGRLMFSFRVLGCEDFPTDDPTRNSLGIGNTIAGTRFTDYDIAALTSFNGPLFNGES
jgi:hypothetical protein